MEDTIREKIIQEIFDLYDEFTFESVTNPTIHRGRQIFDPESEPPPIITILPRIEESVSTPYGMSGQSMPVDIICLERVGTNNPSELGEKILGELIACFAGVPSTSAGSHVKTGGLSTDYADGFVYRSGGIDAYPDELGHAILHIGITVIVKYQTLAGDPYNNE
jgi:hypothetical protein